MSGNPESNQKRASRIPEDNARAGATPDLDISLRPGENVTLELDAEIIAWFKEQEDDHETAINAALRDYIERRRRTP